MLWDAVKLALNTISRNVLRSSLTLLGIVIGVASVIALVTLGQGTTNKVTADLARLGSNMLIARPGSPAPGPPSGQDSRSFTARDVESLRSGLRNIKGVAPSANKQAIAVNGTASIDTTVTGTEPDYFAVQDWSFSAGGPFGESDARAGAASCVIGETVRRDLFGNMPAVDASVRVAGIPCTVVGVLTARGQSAFGSDQDSTVIMPLRTFQRRIAGSMRIATIAVSTEQAADLPTIQAAMEDILRETRRITTGEEDDFTVRDMTQLAATLTATSTVMTGLLGAVAAVSLLVGGIGIMNIMLVSVTERTREIGIRLAIGALASQVLTQFLVEAVMLCLLGGVIGIVLGLSIAALGASLLDIPLAVDPAVMALAFAFSGAIGLVFGYFPARRAANLDPIEALRHE